MSNLYNYFLIMANLELIRSEMRVIGTINTNCAEIVF